jgi:hypothetical protein
VRETPGPLIFRVAYDLAPPPRRPAGHSPSSCTPLLRRSTAPQPRVVESYSYRWPGRETMRRCRRRPVRCPPARFPDGRVSGAMRKRAFRTRFERDRCGIPAPAAMGLRHNKGNPVIVIPSLSSSETFSSTRQSEISWSGASLPVSVADLLASWPLGADRSTGPLRKVVLSRGQATWGPQTHRPREPLVPRAEP